MDFKVEWLPVECPDPVVDAPGALKWAAAKLSSGVSPAQVLNLAGEHGSALSELALAAHDFIAAGFNG